MECPNCNTVLTEADHRADWDENLDGHMILQSQYQCPKCGRIIHDWEDEYEWLPDDRYPKHF